MSGSALVMVNDTDYCVRERAEEAGRRLCGCCRGELTGSERLNSRLNRNGGGCHFWSLEGKYRAFHAISVSPCRSEAIKLSD